MKKLLILLCVTFISCHVRAEIPVENGRVVFSDTIQTMLNDSEIHARLQAWNASYAVDRKSELILNDSTLKVVEYRFTDYMEMEKRALFIYAVYMRYTVRVIYGDNKCIVRVNRISYFEPEDLKDKDRNKVPLISAEDILLKRKYKVAMVDNAPQKIEDHTLLTIKNLFDSIQKSLN